MSARAVALVIASYAVLAGCSESDRSPSARITPLRAPETTASVISPAEPNGDPLGLRRSLLSALPEDALLVVQLPDIARGLAELETTVFSSVDVSPLPALLVLSQLARSTGAAGPPWQEIGTLVRRARGEAMVALLGVERGWPRLLAAVSFPDGDPAVSGVRKGVVAWLSESAGGVVEEKDGIWTLRNPPGLPSFEVSVRNGHLWFGVGEGTVRSAIEMYRGSFVMTGAGRRCFDREDLLRVQVDVGGLVETLEELDPRDEAAPKPDIADAATLAIGARIENGQFVVRSHYDAPRDRDVVARYFAEHAVDRGFLDLVPEQANEFTLFSLDLSWIAARVRGVPIEGWLQLITDDPPRLMKTFGPNWLLVGTPHPRGQPSQSLLDEWLRTVWLIEVDDGEAALQFASALNPLFARAEREPFQAEGATGFTLRNVAGTDLTCAVRDGVMYVGMLPDIVRHALKRAPAEKPSIFARHLADVPGNASVISYDATAGHGWTCLMPRDSEDESDPGLEGLQRAVGRMPPAVSWVAAQDSGVATHTRSAMGLTRGASGSVTLAARTSFAFIGARIGAAEETARTVMESVSRAQAHLQASCAKDRNRNGSGEYGFFSVLLDAPASRRILPSGLAPDNGILRHSEYSIRLYLPGKNREFVAESDPLPTDRVDATHSEIVWCAYAWPVRELSGCASYFVNQSGDVYECRDGGYGGAKSPPADLLYVDRQDMYSDPWPENQPTRDGSRWRRVN